MTILDKLKNDHDKVRKILKRVDELLDAFPDFDEDEGDNIVDELMVELAAHNEAEEEVFYDALREKDEDNLLAYEGFEEHQVAWSLLEELSENDFEVAEKAAKLKVLKDLLLHHIKEEESKIFDYARKCLSASEQKKLGEKFDQKKEQINDSL
jgi:hemerythrin-like domain-containing protein